MGLERQHAPNDARRVEGVRGKSLVVDGEARAGAFLIWPEGIAEVGAKNVRTLETSAFEPLFNLPVPRDVTLIGSGSIMAWPDFALIAALRKRGMGPEVMDSRAAARTYNLLLTEERAVAALILPLA